MKFVIYPAVEEERLKKIQDVAGSMQVANCADEASAEHEIVEADGFFGKLTPPMLAAATKLRWVQSPTASLEHYVFPELVRHPCELTNMRGLYGDVIADHVFGYVLCFARNLHRYIRQQLNEQWGEFQPARCPRLRVLSASLGSRPSHAAPARAADAPSLLVS
ncbi:MAG: hypothetical protein MK538_00175, partial [Planctomycetes bacterium]|nr:hypothetical protein [Planctomycetota bacterium]